MFWRYTVMKIAFPKFSTTDRRWRSQHTLLRKFQRVVGYIMNENWSVLCTYKMKNFATPFRPTISYIRWHFNRHYIAGVGLLRCKDIKISQEETASRRPTSTSSPHWEFQVPHRHRSSSSTYSYNIRSAGGLGGSFVGWWSLAVVKQFWGLRDNICECVLLWQFLWYGDHLLLKYFVFNEKHNRYHGMLLRETY
jgi:hypothetical protein